MESTATPEQKRFNINPESIQQMQRAKDVFKTLSGHHPFLAGITFFGSRTRGDEKEGSDLDAIIFYDNDKGHGLNLEGSDVMKGIRDKISEAAGVELGTHVGWSKDLSVIKTDMDIYNFIRSTERLHTLSQEDLALAISRMPEAQNLFSRFFLGIGEGLQQSRGYVLDQFSNVPDGDRLFSELMSGMRSFEGDNRKDGASLGEVKYPRTVEEARKYFVV